MAASVSSDLLTVVVQDLENDRDDPPTRIYEIDGPSEIMDLITTFLLSHCITFEFDDSNLYAGLQISNSQVTSLGRSAIVEMYKQGDTSVVQSLLELLCASDAQDDAKDAMIMLVIKADDANVETLLKLIVVALHTCMDAGVSINHVNHVTGALRERIRSMRGSPGEQCIPSALSMDFGVLKTRAKQGDRLSIIRLLDLLHDDSKHVRSSALDAFADSQLQIESSASILFSQAKAMIIISQLVM